MTDIKKIKNFDALAVTETRKTVLNIIEAGLQAIDTEKVIKENISLNGNTLIVKDESFSLSSVQRIFIVGIGKCSARGAFALEGILGDKLSGGIALDISESYSSQKLTYLSGDHPFPSDKNVNATAKIITLLESLNGNDLVIFIVSGGGSVLLTQPTGITVADEVALTQELFEKGATIQELNTVRKHISLARGGNLLKYAHPAKSISVIFSDVPGNDITFIASGPTVKDKTTVMDAEAILHKYYISVISPKVLIETPKDDMYFESSKTFLLVSNEVALRAMADEATTAGYKVHIETSTLTGEAKDVGRKIVSDLHSAPSKSVFLYGGETTVTMENTHGEGGRNQELVLSLLKDIKEGEIIASVASDGHDDTPFAGALCDMITVKKVEEKGLDVGSFLTIHNSYAFWKEAEDYLETGLTGSNVSDFVIALKE